MKLKIFLIILFAIMSSAEVFAQQTPEKLIDKFFNTYLSDGASKALDDLYATNSWMERHKDTLEKVKSQLENFVSLVGKYYGKDIIVKKELGDSFILISYLVKYDRQPVRFTFQFYKPQKEWRCHSFSYDDSFDEEIEEAAKLYYLKSLTND